MTWERFIALLAIILPLITFGLGYFGSLYTEARREKRQREQTILNRIADTERDALLELQRTLPQLVRLWGRYLAHDGTSTEDVESGRSEAMALASRITDDDLRRRVEAFVEMADGEIGWGEGEKDFGADLAWGELTLINDDLGQRLRSG
jgi:hypothetical protein